MVVVDDPKAALTQAVLTELSAAGVAVLICGNDQLPSGIMLPIRGHQFQTARMWTQLDATAPRKKRIRQAFVRAKIRLEAAVLRFFNGTNLGLEKLVA